MKGIQFCAGTGLVMVQFDTHNSTHSLANLVKQKLLQVLCFKWRYIPECIELMKMLYFPHAKIRLTESLLESIMDLSFGWRSVVCLKLQSFLIMGNGIHPIFD